MRPMLSEPQGRLLRAVTRLLVPQIGSNRKLPFFTIESIETTDWGSLTFAGQRHRMTLVVPGMAIADVPSLDALDLGAAIVAEARVVSAATIGSGVVLTIAVMVVETVH
ncbi:MAG: hypothetical protein ACRYG4_11220 [Janthinobacterium lividum]